MAELPVQEGPLADSGHGELTTGKIASTSLGASIAATFAAVLLVAIVVGVFLADSSSDSDDGPGIFIATVALLVGFPIGALVGASVGGVLVVSDRPRGRRWFPIAAAAAAAVLPALLVVGVIAVAAF